MISSRQQAENPGSGVKPAARPVTKSKASRAFKKNWDLYLMLLPVALFFLLFHYWPMYGVQIAFKLYLPTKGIWGSSWLGFDHFMRFFNSFYFWRLIKNTLGISFYQLIIGFPIPILLALAINEVKNAAFKKTVQTVTYAPHFLSIVVLTGTVISFLSPQNGIINSVIKLFGREPIYFMLEPAWFKSIYVWSGIWQNAGWGTIIYLAALAGIDNSLYEAAMIDGASKLKRIMYITIPSLMPTAIIILILDCGTIMNIGFEKIFLMQNNLNLPTSDVIPTYVYRSGILGAEYSFSTAIGLFNSVINLTLLLFVNKLSRKVSETSLW
ncbi:ABC transporter permease subunit [Paenibacillus qinlingensis]|uniref:Aldouronate transport system permease protein n=1 Tax=Paenibacillus qinlingensis TaxID=1837343 RepID=A0ABU1P120_9BACL|nr:ABC transporter permease subunit [Paenibacillus qinlingensis]MDR6553438.1 putative aldouronate transport system permease protein [Paenibacillus qinlingensis]